ncbi:helicase-associated domain-containing protein [Janibacter alittae]|uniref:Helicase-associated domain-containing protein n=1 Tax=Janibacter alittae TaxID=3115209 RepID=A0ABZ2MID6_9MICO
MRSLAEDIRRRTDEELVALLELRPDLARPQPADLTALAARASTRASTARAIDHLDLPHLSALQACLVAGVDTSAVADLLDTHQSRAAGLIDDLARAALLWESSTGRQVAGSVAEVLGPHPAGLGPPASSLQHTVPDDLPAAIGSVGAEAERVLTRIAWHGPTAARPSDTTGRTGQAVGRLLDAGLLVALDAEHVIAPREVGLSVRGGRLLDAPLDEGGDPAPARELEDVDRAATAAATELVALVDELLDRVEAMRPRVLRSGGLAVRDLRGLASRMDLDEASATLLLELAFGAALVADDRALEPTWRLTTEVEAWRALDPAHRWVDLAKPWLTSLRSCVVPAPDDGGRVNALSDGHVWPPIRPLRREVLTILAELPEGSAPEPDRVVELLRRRRPRRMPHDVELVVAGLLREGEVLGVTGRHALGTVGRALLEGSDGVAGVLADFVPDPVDRILLQADLTAIVPGAPVPELAALLRRSAVLESRGGAGVHRFTEASLRSAMDSGWAADDLLESLSRFSATEVPQPLDYLVRDVARRHGQLRGGAAGSYLRGDDPTHLEALLAHRDLGHLQLRQIAPTVLISPVGPAVLVEALREAGQSPALESSGGVVSTVPAASRVSPRRDRPVTEARPDPAPIVLARLRAGEDAAERRRAQPDDGSPVIPALDPASTSALLREAAADRLPAWIGITDSVGATKHLLFHPVAVDGGRVMGEVDAKPQVYSLHRITGVVVDG